MTYLEIFLLLGGVGLFLYGMSIMSTGLRNACGDRLQHILEGATSNKFRAILVGIAVTVLVQSSSATDVMVIGFVNSELMTLGQAIGVIMGANIGTTVTAQITAFNVSAYAPLLIFLGAVIFMFVKKQVWKHIGSIILGFGMLFQGIKLMKDSILPLSETEGFKNIVTSLSNPFLLLLFGVAFTALLQSSSSATVIFQAFAIQGLIEYKSCVYLVIGSAIGSVTPNLLASLTTNRDGKRTALLNLLFNLIRAAIMFSLVTFFPKVLEIIQGFSPDNVARQIANTHTIFAILAVLLIAPFSGLIVKLARRLIPLTEEESQVNEGKSLMFLSNLDKIPPSMAFQQARKEVARMAHISRKNFETALDCFYNMDDSLVPKVAKMEETVNYLDKNIIAKLVELRSSDLPEKDKEALYYLVLAIDDIERISDFAENITGFQQSMRKDKIEFSKEAVTELKEMCEKCKREVEICFEIFETGSEEHLREAIILENDLDNMQETLMSAHIKRLMEEKCNPSKGVVFTDMVTLLERCSDHALSVAYSYIKPRK